MRQAYPVIFTQIDDKKNTVLIEVPDLELMTEGLDVYKRQLECRNFLCKMHRKFFLYTFVTKKIEKCKLKIKIMHCTST